jgi:hypothetical protein
LAERHCPLCGDLLFPWVRVSGADIDRCETCGLGVPRDPAPTLPEVTGVGREEIHVPNRAGLQAVMSGSHWALLGASGDRQYFTPASLELLLKRGGVAAVSRRRLPTRQGLIGMWQTLLNALTFGDNVALELIGRPRLPIRGPRAWFDALISGLAAAPVALIALPLELIASLAGRGGVLVVTSGRGPRSS